MIVERLSLTNFRGFEQIDLEFEPDVNVIAGVNGVGKSGVLAALAMLFSRALPHFTKSSARHVPVVDEDVRFGSNPMLLTAKFSVGGLHLDTTLQKALTNLQTQERLQSAREELRVKIANSRSFANQRNLRKDLEDVDRLIAEDGQVWSMVPYVSGPRSEPAGEGGSGSDDGPSRLTSMRNLKNQPQVIYFSTRRLSKAMPRTLDTSMAMSVRSAFEGGVLQQDREVQLRDLISWYRFAVYGESPTSPNIARDMVHVINRFIPGISWVHLGMPDEGREINSFQLDKHSIPLSIMQLSDGERGLFAIVLDLTRRLVLANPGLAYPVREGKAIVLIDEIELHLHPSWQRTILKSLRETFENCQFIVTTHSPQVIGEVDHRNLRFLVFEDFKVTSWTPPRSLGLDSNRILEELMDVKARNAEIDARLSALASVIDDEDFDRARAMLEELAEVMGPDDPELTHARSLIAFIEGPE